MAAPPGSSSGPSPGLDSFPQMPIEMTTPGPSTSTPSSIPEPSSSATATPARRFSNASALHRRLSKSFQEAELPSGFMGATADMTSSVFAAGRTRSSSGRTRSSTGRTGHTRSSISSVLGARPALPQQTRLGDTRPEDTTLEILEEQRLSMCVERPLRSSLDGSSKSAAKLEEETVETLLPTGSLEGSGNTIAEDRGGSPVTASGAAVSAKTPLAGDDDEGREYTNGYHFPPQYSAGESFQHSMVAFWNYARTPLGFFVVVYGLNVVAWGGMLFLLLCNASPAMCHPSCNDINSARRIWIEIDSQILNSFFCVTGFGLAPWRLRDLYYLLHFRLAKRPATKELYLRRLGGVHSGWIRLPGSQDLPVEVGPGNVPPDTPPRTIPFPESKIPDAPLTGERAPATILWHIDFVLWMNASNTFLQCVLSGFMWGMNRYRRPSWSTGLFVALGCIAGIIGGLAMFFEGKRVKSIEGVPLTEEDYAKLESDRAHGILHYNNLKGKRPKEKHDEEAGKK